MDDHPPSWEGNGVVTLAGVAPIEPNTVRVNVFLPHVASAQPPALDALALARGIAENFSLRAVELYRCGLGPEHINALAQALCTNKYVSSIGLSRNKYFSKGAIVLSEMIKVNQTITTLDLGWNELRDEAAAALAEAIAMNNSLQRLILDRNKLTADGVSVLAHALRRNHKVRYLGLSDNGLRGAAGAFLGQMLAANDALATLDLSFNGLPAESVMALMGPIEALGRPCSLTTLNLAANRVGPVLPALAAALPKLALLRELNLEFAYLEPTPQLAAFAKALCSNRSLCNLSFAKNDKLGDEGVTMLCTALAGLGSLRYLDLGGTNMTRNALPAVQVLLASTGVTTLHLDHADFSEPECGRLLRQVATASPTLQLLNVATCRLVEAHVLDFVAGPLPLTGLILRGNDVGQRAVAKVLAASTSGRLSYLDVAGCGADVLPIAQQMHDVFETNAGLPYVVLDDATVLDRARLKLPWKEVHRKAPPGLQHRLPPICNAQWDLQQGFPPSAGFATYSVAHGTPMRRHYEGEALVGGLLAWAGRPVKHCSVWEGNQSGSVPSLRTRAGVLDHRVHPTSVEAYEGNIGGLLVSDDQLRREFNRLDVNGDGFLSKAEFKRVYESLEHFGLAHLSADDVDRALRPFTQDNRITFDEFCIVMLRLVSR